MEINNLFLEYNKIVKICDEFEAKIRVEHKTFLVEILPNPFNQQSLAGSLVHEGMAAVNCNLVNIEMYLN